MNADEIYERSKDLKEVCGSLSEAPSAAEVDEAIALAERLLEGLRGLRNKGSFAKGERVVVRGNRRFAGWVKIATADRIIVDEGDGCCASLKFDHALNAWTLGGRRVEVARA